MQIQPACKGEGSLTFTLIGDELTVMVTESDATATVSMRMGEGRMSCAAVLAASDEGDGGDGL